MNKVFNFCHKNLTGMNKFLLLLAFIGFFCVIGYSQTITISDNIMDEVVTHLVGVSIVEKGTSNGTTSNVKHSYTINIFDSNAVFTISSVGYITQEMNVKNNYSNIFSKGKGR